MSGGVVLGIILGVLGIACGLIAIVLGVRSWRNRRTHGAHRADAPTERERTFGEYGAVTSAISIDPDVVRQRREQRSAEDPEA